LYFFYLSEDHLSQRKLPICSFIFGVMALFWGLAAFPRPTQKPSSTRLQGKPKAERAAAKAPLEQNRAAEMTLISQMQHEKEELGWRQVAKQPAEEAATVGRPEQFK
ncbi:hypothetical protein R7O13_30860, partial [Vibrio sp. Y176]|uniref:hypothetical protein n=1 Tax=Vibrio sp. Y176 TaxID=3074704 RepID=UPI0029659946